MQTDLFQFNKPDLRQLWIFADSERLRVASNRINRSVGMELRTPDRLHILQRRDGNKARSIGVTWLHLNEQKKKSKSSWKLFDGRSAKINFSGESEAGVHKISNDLCSRGIKSITVKSLPIITEAAGFATVSSFNFLTTLEERQADHYPMQAITAATHDCRWWTWKRAHCRPISIITVLPSIEISIDLCN